MREALDQARQRDALAHLRAIARLPAALRTRAKIGKWSGLT
jgi:hypothetical protein